LQYAQYFVVKCGLQEHCWKGSAIAGDSAWCGRARRHTRSVQFSGRRLSETAVCSLTCCINYSAFNSQPEAECTKYLNICVNHKIDHTSSSSSWWRRKQAL